MKKDDGLTTVPFGVPWSPDFSSDPHLAFKGALRGVGLRINPPVLVEPEGLANPAGYSAA
jgi:hypothetical protein